MIPNFKNVCSFLVLAKKATYASGNVSNKVLENDGSSTFIFQQDNWKYHDNYFGGEPFGGREIVSFCDVPYFLMVYYGGICSKKINRQTVYIFLQEALSRIPEDKPFRGPQYYAAGELRYVNTYEGEINHFSGEEVITFSDKSVLYKAKYIGGLVNQKTSV